MKLQACGLTVLRVVVGIVFVAHGYQKLFKIGFHGVADMFGHMGIPLPLFFAVVVTLVEFVGGILLIAGIAVQISAALIAMDMVVAILKVHLPHGFFSSTGGMEFPLTLLAAAVCLSLSGGGAWSLKK
jgi:putative oxidoreductase